MKVLQINSTCGYGSTGKIAVDLYKTLLDKGHDCVIAYGRYSAPDVKTIKIGGKLNNYIHVFETRLFDNHGLSSRMATEKLIRQISDYGPDIINLHNVHGYYINYKILFKYLKKIDKPVVWTLHDCWAFTGHCAHFDYVNCDKWEEICHDCPQSKEYPKSLLADRSRKNFEIKKELFTSLKKVTLVTPSNWLAGLVKRSFLNVYPIKVINNGIDLNTFKPTSSDFRVKYDLQDKKVVLGVANVWSERKGFDYLIKLSKMLDETFKIIIVGLTPKQKDELPENIIGITRTNSVDELVKIYSAADIFVNPTLEDNFPTTNIEALACGTPVVTFDSGGSAEMIDESCGYKVERGDLEGLGRAINNIDKKDLSAACTEMAAHFNKNDRYVEYLELYKEVMI
ncbi:MAG: glycosyltransferase [Eubacteriales bacterium]